MKSLRHLLRRASQHSSKGRRRTPATLAAARPTNRRLTSEALERRQLLAGDLLGNFLAASQNPANQFDVNSDSRVTALDALGVINFLGRGGESQQGGSSSNEMYYDVNGDSEVTAVDALGVINAIGSGEGQGDALIELLLTARRYNEDPGDIDDVFDADLIGPESEIVPAPFRPMRVVPDANEPIEVAVNEIFDLELSYDDFRESDEEGGRLGAFRIISDIFADQAGVLQPVLFETQQLVLGSEIDAIPVEGTTITFSIPEAPPGVQDGELSVSIPSSVFPGIIPATRFALNEFGYTNDQFRLSRPSGFDDDKVAQVHWTDITFADMDLPNITLEVDEAAGAQEVPTETIEIPASLSSPINPIPFNLDVRSRTYNENEAFYSSNILGSFDPSFGFTDLQGIGLLPAEGGGIPDVADNDEFLPYPFDAYSVPVRITQPVTGLVVSVRPTPDANENVLLYGSNRKVFSDDEILQESIGDADAELNGKSQIIINAVATGNNPPTVSQAITATFSEDDGNQSVDLLQFASDPDGDPLMVTNFSVTGDPQSAVTQNGNNAAVNTGAYGSLNDGQSQMINVSYDVSDGNGGSVAQMATITINGVSDVTNQPPTVSQAITETYTEDDGLQSFSLLSFSNDPDGDPLMVTNFSVNNDPAGAIQRFGNDVNVTTGNYNDLNDGQNQVITLNYTLDDGNGGTVGQTATVTITGVTDDTNSAPTVSQAISETFSEDDGTQSVDLLEFASDPDGDSLAVTNFSIAGDPQNAVSQNGNSAQVDTGAYGGLNDGQNQSIIVSYVISDGNGGTVNQTANITITGVTDNSDPTVSQPISRTFSEDAGTQNVDLLEFSNDADGDTLNISGLQISNDPNGAVSQNGNSVDVVTGAYDDLDENETQVINLSYNINDGNGGSVSQTATITITGDTDNTAPVVSAPVTASFTEGGPVGSVDLLAGASDADGDNLNVSGLSVTGGDDRGITVNGNTLSVDPGDYGRLLPNDSEVIQYDYNIVDGSGGSVQQTATITINGVTDDEPTAGNVPDQLIFADSGANTIDVLNADGIDAGAGEDQDLSIVAASLSDPSAGSVAFNGEIVFTPAAGFEGDTTINYTISDGTNNANGSINVSVVDFVPSTVGGYVFIDRMENPAEVFDGADPIRNGQKDANEQGLGGVPVTLRGNGMSFTAYTDLTGSYQFANVAPGSYEVEYIAPPNVIPNGPATMPITIGAAGGEVEDDMNFALLGLTAESTSSIDILARTYLNRNGEIATISNGGREGGLVSFDSSGQSNFILAGEGFEGVKFADVRTINGSSQDMALLTLLTDNGDVLNTMVSRDRGVMGPNGSTLRFFGGREDFSFQNAAQNVSDFDSFQAAIDQILANM